MSGDPLGPDYDHIYKNIHICKGKVREKMKKARLKGKREGNREKGKGREKAKGREKGKGREGNPFVLENIPRPTSLPPPNKNRNKEARRKKSC